MLIRSLTTASLVLIYFLSLGAGTIDMIDAMSFQGSFPRIATIVLCFSLILQTCNQACNPSEAQQLRSKVKGLYDEGRYDEALPLAQRMLELDESRYGATHQEVAVDLIYLATLFTKKMDYAKAEPLYKRAIQICEKVYPPNDPVIAINLNSMAGMYMAKGDFTKAEQLFMRSLEINEKHYGKEHAVVANDTNNLAVAYWFGGEFTRAIPFAERTVAIQEKLRGLNAPEVADALVTVGMLYDAKGYYAKAEKLYQRALDINEKAFGPNHLSLVKPLNYLAKQFKERGDYEKAESLYKRVLEIRESSANRRELVYTIFPLANLYVEMGESEKAEPLYLRGLQIAEAELGSDDPDLAQCLAHAGIWSYLIKNDYEKAELLLRRALTIEENKFGPERPSAGSSLIDLARLYIAKGDYQKAEPLLIRALKIFESFTGKEHPDVAAVNTQLGELYYLKSDYSNAEFAFKRALAITEKTPFWGHYLANALSNLANLYLVKGEIQKAIDYRTRSNDIRESDLVRNILVGSERQKLNYLNLTSLYTDLTLSLHSQFAPNNLNACRMAFTSVLRRKGRTLDALRDTFSVLRQHADPQGQALIDQLAEARKLLSTVSIKGPTQEGINQFESDIKTLENSIDTIESKLNASNAELVEHLMPVELDAVQKALPPGTALIEFAYYQPYDAKIEKLGSPHCLAYVMTNLGKIKWADLGEVAPIETAIAQLRDLLRDPESDINNNVRPLARSLDEKVMQPVRSLLDKNSKLLISPDGALNLIPFGALVDESGHFLIERYNLSYLSSGRDLLSQSRRLQAKEGPIIVGNPDYGEPLTSKSRVSSDIPDYSQLNFSPLNGMEKEAQDLKKILPEATLLLRKEATESAIKNRRRPTILHMATHGFFLEDVIPSLPTTPGRGANAIERMRNASQESLGNVTIPNRKVENPLLRSGLALAGANQRKSGNEDGILTGLETMGLDLRGTEVVVLSACDTGIGKVKTGEGVYGLRRALVLAGSESQVLSLWPISDDETKDLMIAYYKRLRAGQGRRDALRQAQLNMLKKEPHPFYWASFIQSGQWGSLNGKR